ncbi:unnamed protein product [Cylicocyclus nassatus]|uniref:GATA-type domain-containing protein n=1 Tax=Cylicocyclus nassatus TaxID=53992 RepID=A0AA36HEQ0_CYLNA|nr:unnamed protein product [Cylicocyclus nassatus]
MDPHHSDVPLNGGNKKVFEDERITSFHAAPLFELPHSNSMNMLLYDLPPMRMYPSSSQSELDANTSTHVSNVFPIPSDTYLHQSDSLNGYILNGYSPPPQDPAYPPKPPTQHLSPLVKQKKRIQAVPCHSNSVCANCKTTETTLWRRAKTGEIECNACNLYFRKNNTRRPMSLCKDTIMKRNRKPRSNSSSSKQHSTVSG